MKRFTFRLDRVLKLRKRIEEKIELDLSMKQAELFSITNRISKVHEQLTAFTVENRLEGTFTVFDLLAVDNYIFRLETLIEELEKRREECEREFQTITGALIEARKARKAIQNLRERRFDRYREELNRWEDARIDDMNQSISHNREMLTVEEVPMEDM